VDRQTIIDRLELADWHVAEGTFHVNRQRRLIEALTREHQDTTQANEILKKFEEILATHTADRDRLLKELKKST